MDISSLFLDGIFLMGFLNVWSAFFSILLIGWIWFCSWLYTCKYHQLCDSDTANTEENVSSEATAKNDDAQDEPVGESLKNPEGFQVYYKNDLLIQGPDYYKFTPSSVKPEGNDDLTEIQDSLSRYLINNPDKQLEITALYQNDEKNESEFESLGLARAQAFQSMIEQEGIEAQQFLLKDSLAEKIPLSKDNNFQEVFKFQIKDLDSPDIAPSDELTDEERALINATQYIYFNFASSQASLAENKQKYFLVLAKYLKASPKARIEVSGHTDSIGTMERNLFFSSQRAEHIKLLLLQSGIPSEKVSVLAKGPSEPIADNSTEAGRSKNRRVEIKIKK